MIARLGIAPSQSTPSSDPTRQQIWLRPSAGGLAARAHAAAQARGPHPGSRAAASLALPVSDLAGAIDIHGPASAGAGSDVAADPAGGRLVSRGIPFLFPSAAPAREADNDDGVQAEEESRPHLLATTKGRYDLRHGIVSLLRPDDGTRGPAVCGCGLSGHDVDDVAVHLSEEGRAYVTGVFRCDSALLCPTCAPRRAFEIQERLTKAVEACIAKGGSVWFVTPTAQRSREQDLALMRVGVHAAWREARQGAGWVKPAAAAGVLGVSTVMEAPWSPATGWGVHLHALVFFDHQDERRARKAVRRLLGRYLRRLRVHGLKGTSGAQQAERCRDAEKAATYCGKLASELAHGWVKEGRKAGSTSVHPFAIAAKATLHSEDGAPMDIPGLERVSRERCRDLWREYAAAMPGTRLGVISPSLARKLGIEAADDEEGGGIQQLLEEERIGQLPSPTWNRLVRRALAGTFLSKIETEVDPDGYGWEEVEAWALEAGAEDTPGDDAFLRRDPLPPAVAPQSAHEIAARTEVVRAHMIAQAAARVCTSSGAGTRDRIRWAIEAAAAAVPDIAPPTPDEVVRALAQAA